MYGIHPRKLTCPLKRDYFSRESLWTNHWFSGDMLVLRGVFTLTLFTNICLKLMVNTLATISIPSSNLQPVGWFCFWPRQGSSACGDHCYQACRQNANGCNGKGPTVPGFFGGQMVTNRLPETTMFAAKNRQNDRGFQPSIFQGYRYMLVSGRDRCFGGVNNWTTHLKKDHAFHRCPNILTSTLWSKLGSPKPTMDLGEHVVPKNICEWNHRPQESLGCHGVSKRPVLKPKGCH